MDKKNKLSFFVLHGEANSSDRARENIFRQNFNAKSRFYAPEYILNVDETGLYIKGVTNKSYVLDAKKDKSNTKSDKTRLPSMLIVLMTEEKFYSLVIGNSKNPRAFNYIDLKNFNIFYRSNRTARLTRDLFAEHMENLNKKFKKQIRKVLMTLDNFSGHKIDGLSNIKFMFSPLKANPSSTASGYGDYCII